MGQHGALLVDRLLEPGDIIGFSWGRAVRSLVENLPQASQSRQVICVPIIGGPSGKLESRYHVNTLDLRRGSQTESGIPSCRFSGTAG
jgi:DNA-binding transcriptional regulator LsrR (DeoR family)